MKEDAAKTSTMLPDWEFFPSKIYLCDEENLGEQKSMGRNVENEENFWGEMWGKRLLEMFR